jgi:transcriptional regulator with XRE-family HTH domain
MVDHNRLEKILDEFGFTELNHIKQIREELGLSVDDLSEICNVSAGELSFVENQQRIPNQVVIIRILRGFQKLGINPHDVFTFF